MTYGACCIDDLSAKALGCDLLIHYGHSCLVPVDHTTVPCLYVFVDIKIDVEHLLASIRCVHTNVATCSLLLPSVACMADMETYTGVLRMTFKPGTQLTVAGTIQFAASVQHVVQQLRGDYPLTNVPQAKPLSPGMPHSRCWHTTLNIHKYTAFNIRYHTTSNIRCHTRTTSHPSHNPSHTTHHPLRRGAWLHSSSAARGLRCHCLCC